MLSDIFNFFAVSGRLDLINPVLFDRFVLTFVGEPFTVKLFDLVINIGNEKCSISNLYGPAETTIVSTFHRVNVIN
jgi:non-ribosomal peptide synthetase component F